MLPNLSPLQQLFIQVGFVLHILNKGCKRDGLYIEDSSTYIIKLLFTASITSAPGFITREKTYEHYFPYKTKLYLVF